MASKKNALTYINIGIKIRKRKTYLNTITTALQPASLSTGTDLEPIPLSI